MKNITKMVSLMCLLAGIIQVSVARGEQSAALEAYNRSIKDMDDMIREIDQRHLTAARKDFVTAFNDAQKDLLANKPERAKKSVERLHTLPFPNKYEQAYTNLIDYWYEGQLGDKQKETEAAEKIVATGAGIIDDNLYVEAGIRLFIRQYNSQDFGSANETLAMLRKTPKSADELANVNEAVQKLDEITSSNKDISQKIKISETGHWRTKLLRQTFLLDKVSGNVQSIDFHCDNKTMSIPYKPDSVMSTPAAWGSCFITVNANQYTTFVFSQLVDKPIAQ